MAEKGANRKRLKELKTEIVATKQKLGALKTERKALQEQIKAAAAATPPKK